MSIFFSLDSFPRAGKYHTKHRIPIVLAGDSAHSMTPFAGLGTSEAIRDAAHLTDTISKIETDSLSDDQLLNRIVESLEKYSQYRKREGQAASEISLQAYNYWVSQSILIHIRRGVQSTLNNAVPSLFIPVWQNLCSHTDVDIAKVRELIDYQNQFFWMFNRL